MKVKVTNIGGGLKALSWSHCAHVSHLYPHTLLITLCVMLFIVRNRVAIPTPTVRRFERPFVPQKPCACTSTRRQIENAWRDTPNEASRY